VIDQGFKSYSERKLRQYLERIQVCLDKLTDDQVWARGHETENSAGNLCLHLSGNIRQWIISGVGGRPDTRDRDSEFAARGGLSKTDLFGRLSATVDEVCGVISSADSARLGEMVRIQGYDVTVLDAIYHIVEHFAYHAGQIVFITKALTGEDMGFYRHLARNQAASGESLP
jgi:uncharacterized damage-inducible protein DinB